MSDCVSISLHNQWLRVKRERKKYRNQIWISCRSHPEEDHIYFFYANISLVNLLFQAEESKTFQICSPWWTIFGFDIMWDDLLHCSLHGRLCEGGSFRENAGNNKCRTQVKCLEPTIAPAYITCITIYRLTVLTTDRVMLGVIHFQFTLHGWFYITAEMKYLDL